MFTLWALDQQDRDDSVGKIAKLMYRDHNDGCAIMFKDATGWLHHFQDKHVRQLPILTEMLGDAYVEYCTTLKRTNEGF